MSANTPLPYLLTTFYNCPLLLFSTSDRQLLGGKYWKCKRTDG